jgi:hypothetical protein
MEVLASSHRSQVTYHTLMVPRAELNLLTKAEALQWVKGIVASMSF